MDSLTFNQRIKEISQISASKSEQLIKTIFLKEYFIISSSLKFFCSEINTKSKKIQVVSFCFKQQHDIQSRKPANIASKQYFDLNLPKLYFNWHIQLLLLQFNFIMQKSKESHQIAQLLNNYAISQEFLDVAHYKLTQQHSRKANIFYQSLCKIFQSNYRLILQLPSKCVALFEKKNRIDRWEICKFKAFLEKMFQIFNMLSEFQIQGLSRLRTSRDIQDNSQAAFIDFISNVDKYGQQQQKLFIQKKNYQAFINSLQLKSVQTLQKMKKSENFYNVKLISSQVLTIQSKIKEKNQLEEGIVSQSEIVSKNSRSFDEQLMFYRQHLIIRKYQNIEKFTKLCKNSKQSLVQMFSYLYEYIKNQKNLFSKKKCIDQISILSNKTEGFKLSELVIHEANEYRKVLEDYIQIVKQLIDCFALISGQHKELKVKQNQLLQNINRYYEYNECDIQQIKLTLNFYQSFLKNFSELGDKLVYSLNNLIQLQKAVSKCTEMTLTLIKCSQHKRSPTHCKKDSKIQLKQRRQQQNFNGSLDMLNDQISEVYILNIINKIYEDFRETTLKIKDQFQTLHPNRRKKINNSMSISYISEINAPAQKRPSKKDVWLWKDWKVEIINHYLQVNQLQKLFKELTLITKQYKEEDKELQKLNCLLKKKKMNGFLKLNEKSLVFEAFDNSLILFIPMIHIDNVDMQLKLMTKTFKVETQLGILEFIDETEGDIKKFYVNTQRALDNFNDKMNQQVEVEEKIILSEEELQFIKKRKKDIEKDLQNVNEYQHFNTLVLSDINIVNFFRVIYSGNPVVIGGKQYENFQSSLMGKYKNFNEKYTPFDKPPPSYYSGVEGHSFFDCPLYSQKVIDYDHYLPKMPMLPETCHNSQTIRVYWVSQQELHIRQTNITSNAPFTQNFYLVQLFICKQEQNNLEIKFYMKLVQLKDFTFKKMIYDKAKEEAKWGVTILIEQVKRVMAKYRKKQGKNNKGNEENQDEEKNSQLQNTQIREFKDTIKKLQTRNKTLLYVLIAVFLINVILNFF